jgi:predicted RNA-binding protein with PUA-like domain
VRFGGVLSVNKVSFDVKLVEVFPRPVPLDELRSVKALAGLELLRRGSRLSVHPVTAAEFRTIQQLGSG